MAWIFDGFEARVNNLGGRCWRQQTGYAPHSHLAGSRGSRLRPFSGAFRASSAADQPRWTGGAAYAGFASEITSLRPRNATGPCSMRTLIRSCVRCGDYLVNLEDAVVEHYPRLSHRYYALKAKALGKRTLDHWDRNAPLDQEQPRRYGWSEAKALVPSAWLWSRGGKSRASQFLALANGLVQDERAGYGGVQGLDGPGGHGDVNQGVARLADEAAQAAAF